MEFPEDFRLFFYLAGAAPNAQAGRPFVFCKRNFSFFGRLDTMILGPFNLPV